MPSSISYTISFSSPLSTHFTHFLPDYHFTLSTRRVFFLPFFLLTSIFLLWPHYNLRYCRTIRRFIQIKIFTFNRDMYFYLGYFHKIFSTNTSEDINFPTLIATPFFTISHFLIRKRRYYYLHTQLTMFHYSLKSRSSIDRALTRGESNPRRGDYIFLPNRPIGREKGRRTKCTNATKQS